MSEKTSYYLKEGAYGLGFLLLIAPAYSTDHIVYTLLLLTCSIVLITLVMISLFKHNKTTDAVLENNIYKQTGYFLFILPGAFLLGTFKQGEAFSHRAIYTLISLVGLTILQFFITRYLYTTHEESNKGKNTNHVLLFYLCILLIGGGLYFLTY